ncbi:uncharacterized protein EI90DRAFT_3090734 [Cantharellus anzutake]|uniref:uncharacterized protein n=1 Tax=Cantharellus anzutake TaxID=1750568 RepID=UPI001906CBC3|nr:uncharacterized protein EI90DRAFT_3090734 [Cantharellus anzutake]KAF8314348.1 hypothetical protein EI90DRAFT_3090734 [Cantharellus anzutake]
MLHSVKEECIDGDSSGREGPPPSPSANFPALRDEQSEVMDETPDGADVPESQPLSFPSSLEPTTPIREDSHPNGIPSPPPHARPSGPSLAYISNYPPSPSPLPHLHPQQMPEYPPAPTVQLVESEGSDRGRSPTPIQNLAFPEWCRVPSPLVSPPPTPPPASQEFHWPETTSEHLTWGDDWVQQDSQYAVGVRVAPQPFGSRTPIDCSDSQAVDYGYYGSDNDVEPVPGVELVSTTDGHAHNPVVPVEGLRSQSMSSQDESSSADNQENDEPVFTPPSRPLSEYSVDDPSGGTQFTPDSIPDSLSFKSEFSASDARKKALEKYREACRELGHLLERMRRRDIVYPEDDLGHLSNQHETDSNHFSPVSDENSAPESPRPLSDELAESLCSSARTMSTSRALEIREVVRATLGHRDPDPLPPSST